MLAGFSVGNYKSFKIQQNFSMIAGKSARHKSHIAIAGERKLLKSAFIYGANAGGKSNFVNAADFSKRIIIHGLDSVNLDKKYFRIDTDMYYQPGIFEYRIIVKGTEYSYGLVISYCKKIILAEWLTKFDKEGKEIYIINRETDEEGKSCAWTEMEYENPDENAKMKVYLSDFGEEISDLLQKKTILSDIAGRVSDRSSFFSDIVAVYEWFSNISVIFPDSKYTMLDFLTADKKIRDFFGSMMAYFDTGIKNIQNQMQELDFDRLLQSLPAAKAEKLRMGIDSHTENEPFMMQINQKIYLLEKGEKGNLVYSKMLMNHGNVKELFEYLDESDGTKRLFDLIPVLIESMDKSVILIDEIDRSLHTNLIKKFLQIYYQLSPSASCQLIATTHDSNLLDLDLLRQDELWFVERKQDHSSQLYSLSKFREQYGKEIDKEYLIGRYGAVPVFQSSFHFREEEDEE